MRRKVFLLNRNWSFRTAAILVTLAMLLAAEDGRTAQTEPTLIDLTISQPSIGGLTGLLETLKIPVLAAT